MEENATLLQELSSLGQSAERVESTLLEISGLTQAFSSEIQRQSEAIEALYDEAVVVTGNFAAGNVELGKAKEWNRQGGRYVVIIITLAALALLFFDWLNG